jgi:hypothetical protein
MSVKPKMHALWLFDLDDKETALVYFKFAIEKLPALGMVPLTIGRFKAAHKGDLAPPRFYVLGEGESEEAFQRFADNEALAESHARREGSTSRQIRHLFDGINLLAPERIVATSGRKLLSAAPPQPKRWGQGCQVGETSTERSRAVDSQQPAAASWVRSSSTFLLDLAAKRVQHRADLVDLAA